MFLSLYSAFIRSNPSVLDGFEWYLDGFGGVECAGGELCDDLHHAEQQADQPGQVQRSFGRQMQGGQDNVLQRHGEQRLQRLTVEAALLAQRSRPGGIERGFTYSTVHTVSNNTVYFWYMNAL